MKPYTRVSNVMYVIHHHTDKNFLQFGCSNCMQFKLFHKESNYRAQLLRTVQGARLTYSKQLSPTTPSHAIQTINYREFQTLPHI